MTTLALPRQALVALPDPENVPVEFASMGEQWESGWIATQPGSGTVEVGAESHTASTVRRWAQCLLAAAARADEPQ